MRAGRVPGFLRPSLTRIVACLGVIGAMTPLPPGRGAERVTTKPATPRNVPPASQPDVIDRLIEDGWKKAGAKPARAATDEEYVRRVYLDVVGRIPSVQEATAFVQAKGADKRERLVDDLLNHPDYDKNFATIWTILLIGRNNQGRMVDRPALTGWLRKQFSANRPWNEVVYDLIAAQGSNKKNGAVNYALAHLEMDAVPLTARTTRLFLGKQIQCTQCHDHPSNASWKQGDFWGINAFFKGLKVERVRATDATGAEVDDHTELKDVPTEAYSTFDRRNGMVGVALPKYLDGRKVEVGGDVIRRVALAKLITDPADASLSKAYVNRMWAHFMGRGFVNPIDDFGGGGESSHAELLGRLADEFKASGYDTRNLVRRIVLSRPYRLSSVGGKSPKDVDLFDRMALKPMSPEQLFESLLTATRAHRSAKDGESDRRRDDWLRQFLFTFSNDEEEEGSSFQGTIPQALMMMNGDLINRAISGAGGSFLAETYARAVGQGRAPEVYMANQIYLSALGRLPTRAEASMVGDLLGEGEQPIRIFQDLFWALLNSNEFVLNH